MLSLITPQISLNETAYAEYGPIYVGAQLLWGTFFDYASYTSALCWMLLFGYPQIKSIITKQWERRQNNVDNPAEQYDDQLNILMRSYKEVPLWWFIVLFLCSFIPVIIMLSAGQLFIPVWTYFVALATGAIVVVPLGWLYALSNFQLVRYLRLFYPLSAFLQNKPLLRSWSNVTNYLASAHRKHKPGALWIDGQLSQRLQESSRRLYIRHNCR